MKFALAQINTQAGNFDATHDVMLQAAQRAEQQGVDVLVFPFPALMGPDPMALAINPAFISDAYAVVERLAKETSIDIVVPFLKTMEPYVNTEYPSSYGPSTPSPCVFYLHNGEVSAHYEGPITVQHASVLFAYTMDEFEEFDYQPYNARVICFMPSFGYECEEEASSLVSSLAHDYYVGYAQKTGTWLLTCSACGAYEDYIYPGGSFALDPSGKLIGAAKHFSEELLVVDVSPAVKFPEIEDVAAPFPSLLKRKPVNPGVPAYDRSRMMWDSLALALRDQVVKRGFDGVVLELDGTLVSSAVGVLSVDALGPMRVDAFICAQGQVLADARTLAKNLRIHSVEELDYAEQSRLGAAINPDGDTNLLAQSIIDMRLASYAAENNLLVLSHVDKTQLAIGSCHSFSAPASWAPFGDVYRTDICALARWRNKLSELFVPDVLGRLCVPTDLGLDPSKMTAEYALATIDAVLLEYLERKDIAHHIAAGQPVSLCEAGSETFVRALMQRLHDNAEYRRFAPNFPVISRCSLDEAATPITSAWVDGVKEIKGPPSCLFNVPEDLNINKFLETLDDSPLDDLPDLLKELGIEGLELSGITGFSSNGEITPEEARSHLSELIDILQSVSGSASGASENSEPVDPGTAWLRSMFSEN